MFKIHSLLARVDARLCAISTLILLASVAPSRGELRYASQGPMWTDKVRNAYYVGDQGSRIMPFAWFSALRNKDGKPFLTDEGARYGYLPNPNNADHLPVGFFAVNAPAPGGGTTKTLSMTCAACHTRQIEVDGVSWRIDGGPGFGDFQRLFGDIDIAFDKAVSDDSAFKEFADRAIGPSASDDARAKLKSQAEEWFRPYHLWIESSRGVRPWGPGRADCVSMIFNRVAGLDIGTGQDRIIPGNIAKADAPVRYPFVWNASKQDYTQWPGFAPNGDDVVALGRNVGEVIGVFGVFKPIDVLEPPPPNGKIPELKLFGKDSSLNFAGLVRLENYIKNIGSPKWPWEVKQELVSRGAELFKQNCATNCHDDVDGELRRCTASPTWKTPIVDVGTDDLEMRKLQRVGSTGRLEGALIVTPENHNVMPLPSTAKLIDILKVSVVGSILESVTHEHNWQTVFRPLLRQCIKEGPPLPSRIRQKGREALQEFYEKFGRKESLQQIPAYEARVLNGVWAAAPYLHNGSVPSLAELLKPPAQRKVSFKVGPVFDKENVGLAEEQPAGAFQLTTTGCEDRSSGDSHCGHDFGTGLEESDRKALIEYLKQL